MTQQTCWPEVRESKFLLADDARHGFRLTDETYTLPPVRISRKEAFSFGLARKLLAHYEGTPLHLDMRSVLDKIAESLEGDITLDPDWLSEHVGVMPEDCPSSTGTGRTARTCSTRSRTSGDGPVSSPVT